MINNQGKRVVRLLSLRRLRGSHTGENIAALIHRILLDFEITIDI